MSKIAVTFCLPIPVTSCYTTDYLRQRIYLQCSIIACYLVITYWRGEEHFLQFFTFIDGFNTQDEAWWSHNYTSPAIEAWQGFSFELVCLLHLDQIKKKLGISGILTSDSSWRYTPTKEENTKGAQIDLLIDRGDRVINLCEMKFSVKPYRITENYEETLRNRMGIFQEQTQTSKTLVHTFVTMFGVADGAYRSIVNSEVTMGDLFA